MRELSSIMPTRLYWKLYNKKSCVHCFDLDVGVLLPLWEKNEPVFRKDDIRWKQKNLCQKFEINMCSISCLYGHYPWLRWMWALVVLVRDLRSHTRGEFGWWLPIARYDCAPRNLWDNCFMVLQSWGRYIQRVCIIGKGDFSGYARETFQLHGCVRHWYRISSHQDALLYELAQAYFLRLHQHQYLRFLLQLWDGLHIQTFSTFRIGVNPASWFCVTLNKFKSQPSKLRSMKHIFLGYVD